MASRHSVARWLTACAATIALLAVLVPGAQAQNGDAGRPPALAWGDCSAIEGANPRAECATATVPKDYGHRSRGTLDLYVARLPAKRPESRIGSLFVNFGGPGGTAADRIATEPDTTEEGATFAALNERFDIVGVDPRGVGLSRPSIDCRANQETQGVYAQPFERPEILDPRAMVGRDVDYIAQCVRLNRDVLPYVSTANFARDLDGLRAAVGDDKMTYLGFSYGTFLGATYESMFPRNTRAIVLDGALDPDQYVNDPLASLDEQSAGFERAVGRFLQACARDQAACAGFGGDDPWDALERLIEQAYASPIPAGDRPAIDGDDVNAAVVQAVYAKQLWPFLARALAALERGDGSRLRQLVDIFYGDNGDGTYDPITDRYFTIGALEQRYPHDLRTFLREGRRSYQRYDHAWWNHGYVEAAWGFYPVEPRGVFRGPFVNPAGAPPTLVVGTTYDPATPYKEARRLVGQLGNARLLTMRGDGHTAYGGNSPCIDAAVDAYLIDGTLPAEGTSCRQEVPFAQPQPAAPAPLSAVADRQQDGPAIAVAPHVKPDFR
ncbi:alpha/beta hydrolase [Conexibacter woesei]|uniref:TAP domain protein n=1 Tax=Conexibacter woesei (strain DSM 14684 / CCUG 47730 / CIP 108061 / JCM 11494 / NBRC 100937 / ID131577) TaxID=469383 RepID=D3F543_CONWI|nr:alpha/beta hydrolase [Conexibacter woesei]ADB48621.1 TAP domain protein [Conexibacter woesei DSM 14684]